jgi:hypothetical protein
MEGIRGRAQACGGHLTDSPAISALERPSQATSARGITPVVMRGLRSDRRPRPPVRRNPGTDDPSSAITRLVDGRWVTSRSGAGSRQAYEVVRTRRSGGLSRITKSHRVPAGWDGGSGSWSGPPGRGNWEVSGSGHAGRGSAFVVSPGQMSGDWSRSGVLCLAAVPDWARRRRGTSPGRAEVGQRARPSGAGREAGQAERGGRLAKRSGQGGRSGGLVEERGHRVLVARSAACDRDVG